MAHEIVMPQLGLSMDSGEIIQWLKKSGERVQAGELLLEVESDKSAVEVEAVESGILYIVREAGSGAIPVGEVIAYLLADGEQPPTAEAATAPVVMPAGSGKGLQAASAGQARQNWPRPDRPPSSPAARRRAAELGLDWRLAVPTGRGGCIKERDVLVLAATRTAAPAVSAPPAEVAISPVALRLAESAGLDVHALARQHPGKRLERADVEEAIRRALTASRGADGGAGVPVADHRAPSHRQSVGSVRRVIAERMAASARTNASVTLTTEADASELVKIRESLKASPVMGVVPSYNAMFAALTARALVEYPYMNASLDGGTIVFWEAVNIGVAVDTERGLVVPVVRDVQNKPLRTLAQEMDDLLARASQGKALPDELTGSTFTLTNLGMYEVDAFTPIINPPECAVLGIGRLVQKVIVAGGEQTIRTMVSLSLTFDHRLVDGAPAARFLQRIKQLVEQPYLWLV
jgi:pyruvate dehydrogenase E2 component (dihydrolipoamide acetyltransferase)